MVGGKDRPGEGGGRGAKERGGCLLASSSELMDSREAPSYASYSPLILCRLLHDLPHERARVYKATRALTLNSANKSAPILFRDTGYFSPAPHPPSLSVSVARFSFSPERNYEEVELIANRSLLTRAQDRTAL